MSYLSVQPNNYSLYTNSYGMGSKRNVFEENFSVDFVSYPKKPKTELKKTNYQIEQEAQRRRLKNVILNCFAVVLAVDIIYFAVKRVLKRDHIDNLRNFVPNVKNAVKDAAAQASK